MRRGQDRRWALLRQGPVFAMLTPVGHVVADVVGPSSLENNVKSPSKSKRSPAWVGGTSVEGRPIVIEHFGDGGPLLFVLSAIHGTERLALTFGERFRASLLAGYARRHGMQVIFIEAANPDGVVFYERCNANGIDLNRNFPTENFAPQGIGGDVPLSEPEAQVIKEAIDASGLSAVVSIHCCIPVFDYNGPGEEMARSMSNAMEEDYRIEIGELGASPGSLGTYVGLEMGLPIITVEFACSDDMDPLIQMAQMEAAFDAAATWISENPSGGEIDFDAMPTSGYENYRSWYAGESAGKIPLRAESFGDAKSERFVLLGGFDGRSRRGVWMAEHIRRELLSCPGLAAKDWRLMTCVNPDGMADGRAENRRGVDVKAAIVAGDSSCAEAAAVLALIKGKASTIFVVESGDADNDSVTLHGPGAAELSASVGPRFRRHRAPENSGLAAELAKRGHRVVQISVGTENFEAQSEADDLATTPNTTTDFSEMVLAMVG